MAIEERPAMENAMGKLTRKDFLGSLEPKWCLGCGCYGIFKALTGVFPNTGVEREKFAVISGIGCSSRFPYYTNTYGFHTIHGRAPTVAMGLKLANPDLSVWVITGDGDALSIGGNHFIHLMRRNPDIKVILFNNQIYGLTKGQASPTTAVGTRTKMAPGGSVDNPMQPLAMAIAAGATFAARATDSDGEMLTEILTAAARHKGVAFVEVLLNCVIFNDGAFEMYTNRSSREEHTIRLKHGAPLLFGAARDKAIRLRQLKPEVVQINPGAPVPDDIAIHDVANPDSSFAYFLSQMGHSGQPLPLGIFRQVQAPVYGEADAAARSSGSPSTEIEKVLSGPNAWTEGADGKIHPLSGR